MKVHYKKLVFGFLLVVCLWTSSAEAKDYKLYYLGGQSNMDGFGYVKDLPDILIWANNLPKPCISETSHKTDRQVYFFACMRDVFKRSRTTP